MRSSFPVFTVIAVVIGALAIAGYFFTRTDEPPAVVQPSVPVTEPTDEPVVQPAEAPTVEPVEATRPVATESPEPPLDPKPAYDLVEPPETLNDSDVIVKKVLIELSPKLAEWLVPEEQVRKWVLAVDKLADGQLPKRYRPMQYPMDKFKAKEYGDVSVMEDTNYERLKPLMDTLMSIDVKLLAAYYQSWKPLLEQAYSQQGEPGTFEDRLIAAIDRLQAVKPLEEKAVMVRPHVFYVYQDEKLEEASDIEKLTWRMGEENTEKLKAYAREFRRVIAGE